MTQEEKSLLLKDLCARLPYGVKVHIKGEYKTPRKVYTVYKEDKTITYFKGLDCFEEDIENVKPYLRPMSSMTEEELHEYNMHLLGITTGVDAMNFMFWIYQRHLDILHFIEKGFALEAPEGMYKTN